MLLLDVGGTKCSFGVDSTTDLHTIKTADFSHPHEILKQVSQDVLEQGLKIEAVSVSFGGQFDFQNQVVRKSVHKTGWEGFSFSKWSKDTFNAVAIADNDANCGAIAEWMVRGEPQSLVYVTVSTGIGSGLVINGAIHRGANNFAGELGHIQVSDSALQDALGNTGTFERLCGGFWLERDFGRSAEELLRDDNFLDKYARNLAAGLRIAVRLVSPDYLVLGGGVTKLGSRLKARLDNHLKDDFASSGTRFEISGLGAANVLLGARELARVELHI